MPRQYSGGGRQPAGSFRAPPHGGPGGPPPPNARSFKERVGALRNLRPFMAMVWRTSPVAHRRVAAAAAGPGAAAGGDALCRQADHRRRGAAGADAGQAGNACSEWLRQRACSTGWACCLLAEFALAVLADLLGRVVSLIDSLLSERVTNASSVRLMEHAATLDLEDFEDAEFQDQLERARRQTSGRMTLMGQLFGQAQDMVTVASFAAGLVIYRAVADCASAAGAGAGLPRRSAFQRAELFARLRPHAGAARARLCAPDGGQRRDRQGSEDLRPQRLPDRPLSPPRRRLLCGQSQAGAAARRLGRAVHRASAPSATTWPTPISPGARWPASSRSAISPSWRARSGACARFSKGCSPASRPRRARRSISTTCSPSSRSRRRSIRHRTRCPSRKPIRQGFVFEDVGFIYPGAERWAVRHLSFTLKAGEVVALVGENGAGKTTW